MKLTTTAAAITSVALVATLLGGTAGATTTKPSNDELAAATTIADAKFMEQRDISGATLERDEVVSSCGALKGSVWYRFDAPAAKTYAAWFQGDFDAGIAAYRITDSGLQEVSCSAVGTLGGVELDAQAEDAFYIQLGNTRRTQGILEFGLSLARWQEETLHEVNHTRESGEQRFNLLSLHGAPRPSDPAMYDVVIGISDQIPTKRGIMSFGLLQEKIDLELVHIPASTTTLTVRLIARYDAAQTRCVADEGDESECAASSPVSDPETFASRDGMGSHLAIEVTATRNGNTLVEQTLLVPFAGQIGGTP